MIRSNRFNPQIIGSQEEADKVNKEFYGKFNYPWPPMTFESFPEPGFGITMLNQDIGCWKHNRITGNPKIWIAGCGTNQAVYTSLKFPQAEVLGTDISMPSLVTCINTANQVGIKNLTLMHQSINDVTIKDEFDYIICTGVIHHNADPEITLNKLAAALKPGGILELMVYNQFHRFQPTAFQEAIRTLSGKERVMDFDLQLLITKKLINKFPIENSMSDFLSSYKDSPQARIADILLQPVEYSYTIESLEAVVNRCNLELLLPCINQFDIESNSLSWNMEFSDSEIKSLYESLTDSLRWQISNLLMFEKSPPFLWFYLQRKNSGYKRKTERAICEEFLETEFEKHETPMKKYILNQDGEYVLSRQVLSAPIPANPIDDLSRSVFNSIGSGVCMKDIFNELKIETSFYNTNQIRINLTTSAFPYLKSVN